MADLGLPYFAHSFNVAAVSTEVVTGNSLYGTATHQPFIVACCSLYTQLYAMAVTFRTAILKCAMILAHLL